MIRRVLTGTICQYRGGSGRAPCRMIRQDFPPEPRAEFQSEEWYRQNRERPTAGRCPYWDHNLGCPSTEVTRLPVTITYDGPEQEPVPSDPNARFPAERHLGIEDE